jgi:hypothetical protein
MLSCRTATAGEDNGRSALLIRVNREVAVDNPSMRVLAVASTRYRVDDMVSVPVRVRWCLSHVIRYQQCSMLRMSQYVDHFKTERATFRATLERTTGWRPVHAYACLAGA